jgi:hypothetical protein
VKRIETKSWNTGYRGELFIYAAANKHTGKKFLKDENYSKYIQKWENLVFGAIIGKVTLTASGTTERVLVYIQKHFTEEEQERELAFGDFTPGRFGLLFSDASTLKVPVVTQGKTGLWEMEYLI